MDELWPSWRLAGSVGRVLPAAHCHRSVTGRRIRGRFSLAELTQIRPGEVQFIMHVTVEIEGQDKPALVAEWLSRRYFEGESA